MLIGLIARLSAASKNTHDFNQLYMYGVSLVGLIGDRQAIRAEKSQ